MALEPRSFESLSLLAYAHLRCGNADAASDILAALQVLNPENAWVARTHAYALLLSEQYDSCLRQIDKCPDASKDKAVQLIRSRALLGLGRVEEARRVLTNLNGGLRGLRSRKGADA